MRRVDLRDSTQLLSLLRVALAAGLLAGCKYEQPWVERRLAAVHSPGPRLQPGQALGPEVCTRLCGASAVEQSCNVATIDIAPNPGARVRCASGEHLPLSPELYERVKLGGEETPLEPEQCQKLCAPSADGAASCVVEPVPHREALRPGVSIDKRESFVLCNTHYPGGWQVDLVGPLPSGRVSQTLPKFRDIARSEAEYFSRCAYYEAASVAAFRRLAQVLVTHGAPRGLWTRARQLARDEARHCRSWLNLLPIRERAKARRNIARRPFAPTRYSTLFELARENLDEGCVGETYGSWLALHQAEHAATSELRAVVGTIARDEAAHAALAFEIHSWLWPQLSKTEQRALRQSAVRAIAALTRPLPVEANVASRVGLPVGTLAANLAPLQELLRRALSANGGQAT